MADEDKVTGVRLTRKVAQRRIREIVKVTANVKLTTHAKKRMAERDIIKTEVYRILKNGDIENDPELTERGEWKCKVTLQLRGRRLAGVVAILVNGGKQLVIVTVEWEDGT